MKRFFVSCFDVTPDFAYTFEYQKSDDKDANRVVYMEAAFNREATSGEFFIEFEKQVKDTDLTECFQKLEAKGVNVFTFPNDDGVTAADAIIRVLTLQCKTGLLVARGKRPEQLVNKVDIKQQEAAKQELLSPKEFDEKTAAALNLKLEDVNGNVKGVMDSVQSHGVELVSHGAKLDSQGVVMEDIKHGFCNVIPELQAKNVNLVKEVAHHILQRDIQEAKTAAQTRKVNEKDAEISALHKREEAHLKKIEQLEKDSDVSKAVENLKEMLQLVREEQAFARAERADNARCAADNARSAEYLASMIDQAEERAAKRPRV